MHLASHVYDVDYEGLQWSSKSYILSQFMCVFTDDGLHALFQDLIFVSSNNYKFPLA
jgi:hypothetical protein